MNSEVRLQIFGSNVELFENEPDAGDLAFMARQLVQATLPYREPEGNPSVWYRNNGSFTLIIRPGYEPNPVTGQLDFVGYPYGSIPRLLLLWITTEALRTKNRRLELGDTLAGFMRQLGLSSNTGRGKRGDAKRLREQMNRLFSAAIGFKDTRDLHKAWLNMDIAPKGELWWDPHAPDDQSTLLGSWIMLGEAFFEAITSSTIPLDIRALRALKQSPMALDFYTWVAHKTYAANQKGKPQVVSWRQLQLQMGGDFARTRKFKETAIRALHQVVEVYPGLSLEATEGGLVVKPGRLAVPSR